jgi:hypothetical protein
MSPTRFLHNSTIDKGVFSNQENSVHAQPTPKQLEGTIDAILRRKINKMMDAGLEVQNTMVEDELVEQQKEFNRHISELKEKLLDKISRSRPHDESSPLDYVIAMMYLINIGMLLHIFFYYSGWMYVLL